MEVESGGGGPGTGPGPGPRLLRWRPADEEQTRGAATAAAAGATAISMNEMSSVMDGCLCSGPAQFGGVSAGATASCVRYVRMHSPQTKRIARRRASFDYLLTKRPSQMQMQRPVEVSEVRRASPRRDKARREGTALTGE